MDIWSDEVLDQIERRVDYAIGTEDDGRVLLIPPQSIKELITEFRRLRAEATPASGAPRPSPPASSGP
jgi:hypothetical protein